MKIPHLKCFLSLGVGLLGSAIYTLADVTLAPLFQSGAVLQQGKPVPVWGTADAGEKVTVMFAGQEVSATADGSGKWMVFLEPLKASSEGSTMVVQGNNTLVLEDVLVGEVWLASGQSNMVWKVRQSQDAVLERASAKFPAIREFQAGRQVADQPMSTIPGTWVSASPETVVDFSAVAYSFARDLHLILDVPVGIITTCWGGTRIESWMSPESALAEHGEVFAEIHQRWVATLEAFPEARARHLEAIAAWEARRDAASAAGDAFNTARPRPPEGPGHHRTPSGLYNGMIAPFVPYALAGFIWYQGEANTSRHREYFELFTALIEGWREEFAQGDLPFYWVQLANYGRTADGTWAFLREAQTQTLALPATGQAVIVDIGDVTDIHPRNKRDVGRRLARLALNRHYSFPVVDGGPVFERAEQKDQGYLVSFSGVEKGLRFPSGQIVGFELAGQDQVFYPAKAEIRGVDSVWVSAVEVPEPVAVRYAWRNAPQAGLFNSEDLPAVPFRTDDW